MDKFVFLLDNSGLGCHIKDLFAGIVAYADNLIMTPKQSQFLNKKLSNHFKTLLFNIICVTLQIGFPTSLH